MDLGFERTMSTSTKSLMDLGLEDQGAKVVFATDEFFVQIKRIPSSSLC